MIDVLIQTRGRKGVVWLIMWHILVRDHLAHYVPNGLR